MIQPPLVKVGMADLNVISGEGILKTTGLGSCVGITLYDHLKQVSGMAHIMLPDSIIAKEGAVNKAKYADTAIPELIERMTLLGASARRLQAKLAGGAQMFAFSSTQSEFMRIGPRNVEMCHTMLDKLDIPIMAEDTGGNYGRTIEFMSQNGVLIIRSVNRGVKEL
jgi:chemotaxis protein CheD